MEIKEILKKYSKELTKIKNMIDKSQKIAIIGHVNPDGDCVGSQLGLQYALKIIGKDAVVINEGEFKGVYRANFKNYFLPDIKEDYDLYIILDTANKERIGDLYKKINIDKTIVIDHHITNNNFGSINWVSDHFISASEMVFLLILSMNIDISNGEGVQYLLNGLLSDNGFFQHIRTNKYLSLLISHKMIEMGADSKKSYNLMFCNNSIYTLKIFSLVLSRVKSEAEGKVLWSYLFETDKLENNGTDFESGMVFKEMMSVVGVKVAVFFKVSQSLNKVEISFRSTDDIDVSQVASFFGGGGHKVAAGASITGDYEKIKEEVLAKIEEIFR